ncbi:MAG: DUF3078 domain-containing protein [Pedobacter sp.]|nr:MAG: DUF3078 domain-containing protein [Pedobacter sp.]
MRSKPFGLLTILFCLSFTHSLKAQDPDVKRLRSETERTIKKDPKDTVVAKWKKGGMYGLNISQGSLSNWAAGGDDFSLAVNSALSLFAFYKEGKHSWDNTFDFNLGYVNTTSLGSRKNDDRFDVLSKYGYNIAPKLDLAGLVNFRSQLFKGYTYDETSRSLASNLFAPAYLLVSAGLDYKPVEGLSIFVSPITSRWVIVMDDTLSAKGAYGVDPGKKSINEIGAFASINYIKEISKTVSYKARLDLFSNYKKNPKNIDINMTNLLSVKLTRVLSATYSLDLIYDDDVRLFGENNTSPGLQIKSLIGVGLLLKF